MSYAYEHWANETPASGLSPETPPRQPEADSFPFSEDLKELEQSLSLGMQEGMDNYHHHRAPEGAARQPNAQLARQVADQVLAYMLDNPLQAELKKLRGQLDEYYRDNRAMAEHVQRLVEENERLRATLGANELEIARFRPVVGNLYFKI